MASRFCFSGSCFLWRQEPIALETKTRLVFALLWRYNYDH